IAGWRGSRGRSAGLGGFECPLCGLGGLAQFGNLALEFFGVVQGQLLLGLLQRHLGHAGLDLQALELLVGSARRAARRRRCGGFGLGRLGLGGALGAGDALGLLAFFLAAQAILAQLEALLGVLGLLLLLLQLADFRLGRAVVLHQRDAGGA